MERPERDRKLNLSGKRVLNVNVNPIHILSGLMVVGLPTSLLDAEVLAAGEPPEERSQERSGEQSQDRFAHLELGPVTDRVDRPPVTYLALGSGGVVVVDSSPGLVPRVVARIAEGRRIDRLLLSGELLLLIETRHDVEAWRVDDPKNPQRETTISAARGPEVPTPASVPVPVPAASRARTSTTVFSSSGQHRGLGPSLRVLEVTQGRVIFALDPSSHLSLSAGDHVKVMAQRLIDKPDLRMGGTRKIPSGETTAVLEVEHVEDSKAMALLGRGDVAEVGDIAALTDDALSERLLFPRRAPFSFRTGFVVRPFLGLDTSSAGGTSKPFGMLIDAFGAWYLNDWPVMLEASFSPVGFAVGAAERHTPMAFMFTGAYATDFFEIGLGGGALVGQLGPCALLARAEGVADSCEKNSGATINQVLRLGSLDGLSVTWRSSIFSRPDRFVFGTGRGELTLPLTSRLGLFGGGGGGENGWLHGEIGVRTHVGGAGARGTLIISASLGYAAVFDGPSAENVGGPSVAFGMEWRL